MDFLKTKISVMEKLGTGLSVNSLCEACGITYTELCNLAREYPELMRELTKWYKRNDFNYVPKQETVEEKSFSDDKSLIIKNKPERKTRKNKE